MDDVRIRDWRKACWNIRYKKNEGESISLFSVNKETVIYLGQILTDMKAGVFVLAA